MAKAKALFDSVLAYLVSKKLFVFMVASVFLVLSLIGENSWLIIAAVYLGGQSIIDSVASVIIKAPISRPVTPQSSGDNPSGCDEQEYS